MASKGQTLTVSFVAWDATNNTGKTGDAANLTLRWVKDGTIAALDGMPSPSEVDATNAPGVYKVALSAADCTCNIGTLCGKSSTSGVKVIPVQIAFENLPTAAPAAAGGVPTVDGSNRVAGLVDVTGFKLASDGLDSISTTAPTGVAANFREMVVQTWRRFFKKSTLTATQLKTFGDNGTTVLTTQAVSDDGTTQTQGASS